MKYEKSLKYGALHVHTRDSIFDGISSKKEMIETVAKLGGKALMITDHGTLTGVMDDLDYAKDKGIKLIYGVEAYVDLDLGGVSKRTHLILGAVNESGMYAISEAVTDSNKNLNDGFPCMTLEILKKHFGKGSLGYGNVIATSACVAGPLGTIISSNDIINDAITKVNSSLTKLDFSESDKLEYEELLKKIDNIALEIEHNEKILEVLKSKKGRKNPTERMAVDFVQQEIKQAKAKIKELKALIKAKEDVYSKYLSFENRLETLESSIKSDEELMSEAKDYATNLANLFGENNFFLELQYHFLESEARIMPMLAKISRELKLPVVATNDAHMNEFSNGKAKARKVAQFLRYNTIFNDERTLLSDKNGVLREPDNELYIKTDEELSFALSHILPDDIVKEAMENIGTIINRCYNYTIPDKKYYPVYKQGLDATKEIRRLANQGIEKRFPGKDGWNETYQKRLDYELDVICSMGYADYHLIVREYLSFGKILGCTPKEEWDNVPMTSIEDAEAWYNKMAKTDVRFGIGLGIGEGRGSAAGSLVCYLLEITGINPIKYDLLFERFLNPERISMPDIDSDFAPDVRAKVIEYVINKYGEAAVCCIATKSIADVKGACNKAARYLDCLNDCAAEKTYISVSDRISKSIDNDNNLFKSIDNCKKSSDKYDVLEKYFSSNAIAYEIITLARDVDGILTALSQHAAGVIIAGNGDVSKCIPLRYNAKTEAWTSQCDKEQAEAAGLLKMDFLGLKTLAIITDALNMIYANYGIKIDVRTVPYTNEGLAKEALHHIYELGNTVGVFQFESLGMQNILRQASNDGNNPLTIEDLIMLNAVYRPGPMEYAPVICDIKNGRKQAEYDTPELENVLKETYGVMVYQEQVMRVCQNLAGYSLAQADNVRKYMSKKKTEALEKERESFINGSTERNIKGCVANGISSEIANKIFDDMISFGKYAFNKSHAAIYAITSFYTGWLKCHYPYEFYTALLNYADDIGKITDYLFDIKKYNIKERKIIVKQPDINLSMAEFSTDGRVIRFGLGNIKGFDSSLANAIVLERKNGPFTSIHDFLIRVKCGEGALKNLISVGAFDSLHFSRKSIMIKLPYLLKYAEVIHSKQLYVTEGELIASLMKKGVSTLKDLEEYSFKSFKITSKTGRLPSIDKINDRINGGKEAYKEALSEFNQITIDPVISEDDYLKSEKELLGAYLTSHPANKYEFESKPINTLCENDSSAGGIVTDLRFVNGHCFFKLEDETGSLDCVIWASNYKKLGLSLENGMAICVHTVISYNTYNDANCLQMVISKRQSISFPEKKRHSLIMRVKNICDLLSKEDEINFFRDDDGYTLIIYDELFSEYRTYAHKVSNNIVVSHLGVKVKA